ncbi:hypothetical protein ACFFOP_38850 [Sinosporangium siamense]|uniref:hypothetical protein n=1 Tax=Sinosporangium siamense TaxID=1367973 RepID=UPI0035E96F2C
MPKIVGKGLLAGTLIFTLVGCASISQLATEAEKALDEGAGVNDVISADAPFRGSPSEKYADGAAGIVIPEPTYERWFSKADTAWAYKKTRQLLEARSLDTTTLLGGGPDAYAKALDPEARSFFLKGLDHKDDDKNTRYAVTSFPPGKVELVGSVVKVRGKLSAEPKFVEGERELHVTQESRFVYPVRPKGKPGPIIRVMVYSKTVYRFWRDKPRARLRVWEGDHLDGWNANAQCNTADGFIHPDFSLTDSGGSGPADDAYGDSSRKLKEGECGSVTGV